MYSTILSLLAAATILVMPINAHMTMKSPMPYGNSTLNNSPLDATGLDFPCKLRPGVYDVDLDYNVMPIGVIQTLSFIGSAVHGGGSCQVSLTTDMQPTKESHWQVIYSIMGGCPASALGNFPDNTNEASTFQFSVPEGITPGNYSLVWTWFNRIGNPQMYMNCAPVTVTGGSSKRDSLDDLMFSTNLSKRTTFPPMFVANINNGCATQNDDEDLRFPEPGNFIQFAGNNSLVPPSGTNCAVTESVSETGSGSAPSTAAALLAVFAASVPVSQSSTPAAVITSAISLSFVSVVPSSFSTVASPIASSAISATQVAPASAPSSTSSAGVLTGACFKDEFNCIGGSSFQQCASGTWSVVQPVALGTQCAIGESSTLNITKRSVRFSRSHLKRHSIINGY